MKLVNLVEFMCEPCEIEPCECLHGNIVSGHACYCHHEAGPRKCPQWQNAEPYSECDLYEATTK